MNTRTKLMLLLLLLLAIVGTLTLSAILPMFFGTSLNVYTRKDPVIDKSADLDAQQLYLHNQRRDLFKESSVIALGLRDAQGEALPSRFFQNYFESEIEILEPWNKISSSSEKVRSAYLNDFSNSSRGDLLYGGVCDTIKFFRETKGVRRHVLVSGLNENWGAFSTLVPDRTIDWGNWKKQFGDAGCATEDLFRYLNHPNVSAVFTVSHQWLNHPKVFSLPLGVGGAAEAPRVSKQVISQGTTPDNRTELLLLAQSDFQHRPLIAEHVIANFNGTTKNRFRDGSDYWQNLRQSKFILCPGGLGWDTYRAWEALCLGTIPIIETYYRDDGFYRVFDDLPVLWVDHFDNVTPSLLETSYPKILARAKEYNLRKLTNEWWVDFINSYRL